MNEASSAQNRLLYDGDRHTNEAGCEENFLGIPQVTGTNICGRILVLCSAKKSSNF